MAKSTTLTEALSTLLYWTVLAECDKKFHFHALVIDGNSSKLQNFVFPLSTVCHLKMTRFFAALLHFVFRFSTVCHLKMTRFFGALLHFGFACPQFVFSK